MKALTPPDPRPGARHPGPPLLPIAVMHVLLFMSGVVAGSVLAGGDRFPSPFEPGEAALRFFSERAGSVRVTSFLQFASAIALGIFTASVTSRLRFLGVRAAGESIALVGGMAASLALAACGLGLWALSFPGVAESPGTLRALHLLTFAAGGPGTVVSFGLLIAGVSVTSAFHRFLPRWVVWLGLVVAGLAELSALVLLVPGAAPLLPLARFPGFVWLIAVAATLPAARRSGRDA